MKASIPWNPYRHPMFEREALIQKVRDLAEQNIRVGTSSWKYEGWLDLLVSVVRGTPC